LRPLDTGIHGHLYSRVSVVSKLLGLTKDGKRESIGGNARGLWSSAFTPCCEIKLRANYA
jgi:hypothetical protein